MKLGEKTRFKYVTVISCFLSYILQIKSYVLMSAIGR